MTTDRAREIAERRACQSETVAGRRVPYLADNIAAACHEYAAPIERERDEAVTRLAILTETVRVLCEKHGSPPPRGLGETYPALCDLMTAIDEDHAEATKELRAKLARVEAVRADLGQRATAYAKDFHNEEAAALNDAVDALRLALTGDERKDGM
jgi:hypothetical protein